MTAEEIRDSIKPVQAEMTRLPVSGIPVAESMGYLQMQLVCEIAAQLAELNEQLAYVSN